VNDLLFLAHAQHSMFDDMVHSLGRGVVYAGASKVVRALPMGGAVLLVGGVLLVAWLAGRRR
jgi:vacuolar-type H+-ATPase subunit I/STV1